MNCTATAFLHCKKPCQGGFTVAELIVAMGVSSIVLGALAVATVGLAKSFNATEMFTRNQAASARLMDAIGMDLRRSVAISRTTSATSNPNSASNVSVKLSYSASNAASNVTTIFDGTFDPVNNRVGGSTSPSTYLTLTLPGFYQDNNPTGAGYRTAMPLISSGTFVRYGTAAGQAADVVVQYRKAYVPTYNSECYIRCEAGVDRVIAERAEYLDVTITAQNSNVFLVQTSFVPTFSTARTASSMRIGGSDRVMLRNPRKD